MSLTGWYYLHINGSLIYKRDSDGIIDDFGSSDLVRRWWPMDPNDRAGAWRIAIEALAAGASRARVYELAKHWGLTDEDAEHYCKCMGLSISRDGTAWCATGPEFVNLMESKAGFGDTALDALAELYSVRPWDSRQRTSGLAQAERAYREAGGEK